LADFLPFLARLLSLVAVMRRVLRVRAAFAPNRLAGEQMRAAYELLVPMVRRIVGKQRRGAERELAAARKLRSSP
jgi:hypothetical protein